MKDAIYNAVGVRIKDMPITPEKIIRAIEEKNDFIAEMASA